MSDKDGGPAFPQTNEQMYADPIHGVIRPSDIYGSADPGMSKRDYFAAQALVACMGSDRWVRGVDAAAAKHKVTFAEAVAAMVYLYADAILAERAKETK